MSLNIELYVILMDFQILSDLHLEKQNPPVIIPKAPILILAGDIDIYPFTSLLSFLDSVSHQFTHVFYIAGNHEYHNELGLSILYINHFITTSLERFNNVYFLQNTYFELDDFVIAGSTLWSFIPPRYEPFYQKHINDYNFIYTDDFNKLTPHSQNTMFQNNTHWLDNLCEYATNHNKKLIIVSHYSPSFNNTVQKKYINDPLAYAFCSDLNYLLKSPVVAWVFGHTHQFTNEIINNNTLLVSNPVGNINEISGFIPDFTIKL